MPENTIQPPMDRLAAFVDAFKLTASIVSSQHPLDGPCLLLAGTPTNGNERMLLKLQGCKELPEDLEVAIAIEFDNSTNPLMAAIPGEVHACLQDYRSLQLTTQAFLCEARDIRCGSAAALSRLAEVMVLMMLRQAIEGGASRPGILAALAHPGLHRVVVSMHDLPSKAWAIDDLATLAAMSRTHFMTTFRTVTGTTPMAYLTTWRLALAQRYLRAGDPVKSVARRVGFGSAAGFSRAYSRAYGHPPASCRP